MNAKFWAMVDEVDRWLNANPAESVLSERVAVIRERMSEKVENAA